MKRAERRHQARRVVEARRRWYGVKGFEDLYDTRKLAIRHPNACPKGRRCGACHHETSGQRRARSEREAARVAALAG